MSANFPFKTLEFENDTTSMQDWISLSSTVAKLSIRKCKLLKYKYLADFKQLTHLDLMISNLSSLCIKYIGELMNLEYLEITGMNSKEVDISPLCKLENLNILALRELSLIEIPKLIRKLCNLSTLTVENCSLIDSDSITTIAEIPNLAELFLVRMDLSPFLSDLRKFSKFLGQLSSMNFRYSHGEIELLQQLCRKM